MNLVNGILLDTKASTAVLDTLPERLLETLESGRLNPLVVIDACARFTVTMDTEKYWAALVAAGASPEAGKKYLRHIKMMFSREYLLERLKTELGKNCLDEHRFTPPGHDSEICARILPLGVLLHIAAGNADGLPAFSVIEGLLAGNINILKLPELDGGLSVDILAELVRLEPKLAEYIYVFDYSSRDEDAVSKLIAAADAVVVWGGDLAVSALRRMVDPTIKLIEWGHKISFAYVTEKGVTDSALYGLARNICETDQLLCSSCQGVFLDAADIGAVYDFCARFLPILDAVSEKASPHDSIGILSQTTLALYNEALESLYNGSKIYRGKACSIIAYQDSALDVAIRFRNLWVKRLPREKLLANLRPHKNRLQTAALLCGEGERPALIGTLSKTGLVRITGGDDMSTVYCGAAHDGEYPLRRYTKVFSIT